MTRNDKLKAFMKDNNLSHKDIAELLEKTPDAVYSYTAPSRNREIPNNDLRFLIVLKQLSDLRDLFDDLNKRYAALITMSNVEISDN